MNYLISFAICLMMTGCTYNISMAHTEGKASDVIDDTASNTPSTSVSVPVSIIPKPSV